MNQTTIIQGVVQFLKKNYLQTMVIRNSTIINFSWGSENHVNQMARLTDLELDVKEPQWMYAQFPSSETPENPQCVSTWHIRRICLE